MRLYRLNASPSNLDYSWEIENLDDPILGNNQTVDMVNAGLYDVELIHITEKWLRCSEKISPFQYNLILTFSSKCVHS